MPPNITIVRGGVRLPASSPRQDRDKFLKLLRYVDPDADHGFGFEGVFLRPGALVTDADLHPGPEYPAIPILLEHMRGPVYGIPGRQRADSVYILWRYEPDTARWSELGRASSPSWEWAIELRPLALRALREARGGAVTVISEDLPAIAGRIATALDAELRRLEPLARRKVVGVLHDQFAARLCA
jgi:hypothetical protein